MKIYYLLFWSVFMIFSCTNNTEDLDTSSFGYDYFPLETGRSWTYQSDSIIYTRGGIQIDTFRSFIKEEVEDYTLDIEGHKVFKIARSMRRNENDSWQRLNTWTAYVDKTRAIRTEENIKILKLVFPILKGQRFDGNIFIDKNNKILVGGEFMDIYKDWRHRIDEVDISENFKGQEASVCKINLVEDESIIDKRDVKETYAKGIGLLYKSSTILELDPSKVNLPWNQKITRGFIHNLTLIDYQ